MTPASRTRLFAYAFALFCLACVGSVSADQPFCRDIIFESTPYTVCSFDLRTDRLALFNLDRNGQPFGTFSALASDLAEEGKTLVFATNAGMYDENLKPIGLYVENGEQKKKINRRDGGGNFHLKPNGVFFIDGDRAGVMETEAYVKAKLKPDFATQSGPMLVIDGEIHPKFSPDGTSLHRRNGVGVVDEHHVVFAISNAAVNFDSFARLFRDELDAPNALFFDGSISSLYSAELGRNEGLKPLGPMIGLAR